MINALENAFLDFFADQKSVKEVSAREYYNSLDKDSLNNVIVTYYILSNNLEDLNEFNSYKPKKSEMIDFICKNLKEIVKSCLINCDLDVSNDILLIANKKGIRMYDDAKFKPFIFIIDMKLGYVKYDKKTKKMSVFIPDEIRKSIISVLKDSNVIECIKTNNELGDALRGITSAYGVIEFDRLVEILEIDGAYLFDYILKNQMTDHICEICQNGDEIIIGLMGLNDEFMLNLNEKHKKYKMKKYSLEDYKKIDSGEYLEHLRSYKKLIKYLKNEFDFSNSELIIFRDMIVMDYIINIEEKEFDATELLYKNLEDFIEKNDVEYKKIGKMLNDIYNEYPKWEKFGNI